MTQIEADKIGAYLRERRLEQKLTLEEVADRTRIRKTYILALEENRFDALPGQVYLVGFLQNYARVLDVPVEPLLAALQSPEGVGEKSRPEIAYETVPTAAGRPGRRLRLRPLVVLALLLMVGVIAGVGWWRLDEPPVEDPALSRVEQTAESQDEAQESLPVAMPVATPSDQNTAESGDAAVSKTPDAAEPAGVETAAVLPEWPPDGATVKVVVDGHGSFEIAIDDGHARRYTAKPGLALSWQVKEKLDLLLAVDGSVLLRINDQEYTLAGDRRLQLPAAGFRGE